MRASANSHLLIVEGLRNTGKPLNGMPGAFEPRERYSPFQLCKAGQPHEGFADSLETASVVKVRALVRERVSFCFRFTP